MHLQPITYRGRLVAAVTRTRFFLADEFEHRPPGDPDIRMVVFMCFYANDVATVILPGPYTDHLARRYARSALLTPGLGELLERSNLNVPRAARALRIPTDELRVAITEHREGARANAAGG